MAYACLRMLFHWGLIDFLVAVAMILGALSVLFSLRISRAADRAPRGWDLIMSGFVVFFVLEVARLCIGVLSPESLSGVEDVAITLPAGALIVAGLIVLNWSFRRHLRASSGS